MLAATAATMTTTTTSSSSNNSSHLQNAMRKMHIEHLLPSSATAAATVRGAKSGSTTGGLGGREGGYHHAAASPAVLLLHPRSLHELLSFHAHPIKRPFHPEMSEGAAAAAVKAFRLVMQYMGDIDAVVQEEEQDVAGEESREGGEEEFPLENIGVAPLQGEAEVEGVGVTATAGATAGVTATRKNIVTIPRLPPQLAPSPLHSPP